MQNFGKYAKGGALVVLMITPRSHASVRPLNASNVAADLMKIARSAQKFVFKYSPHTYKENRNRNRPL